MSAERLGQVHQPVAGEDPLPADVLEAAARGSAARRSPARCAARSCSGRLRWRAPRARPGVRHRDGFAEAGARADHRPGPMRIAHALVQSDRSFASPLDAERERVEVVGQPDRVDAERLGEVALVEDPGQVGGVRAAVRHRAGDAEAGEAAAWAASPRRRTARQMAPRPGDTCGSRSGCSPAPRSRAAPAGPAAAVTSQMARSVFVPPMSPARTCIAGATYPTSTGKNQATDEALPRVVGLACERRTPDVWYEAGAGRRGDDMRMA